MSGLLGVIVREATPTSLLHFWSMCFAYRVGHNGLQFKIYTASCKTELQPFRVMSPTGSVTESSVSHSIFQRGKLIPGDTACDKTS